ncbi:hypothetical protein CS063_08880 [Sporanaerobium hydrogeniformans]|uniref:Uncharacterized protein n=1 Tax=Sporanaerobium hydrogeniformans TaxID=3072179 RepID=A0AC61DDI2_9FIRM|nr:endolytic transglycosylase MltG [Sporanaerobium hydrogeniformans]PHV70637.1 hypothetical protein CS063_08880 [Sporanaerobium hydrogeniformans]
MPRKKSVLRLLICTLLSLFLLTAGVIGSIRVFNYCFNYTSTLIANENEREKNTVIREVSITLTPDMSLEDLAKSLYKENLISNIHYFLFETKLNKLASQLRPGQYTITSNMSNAQILKLMSSDLKSEEDTVTITIPEGFTLVNIADRLEKAGLFTREDFLAATNLRNRSYEYSFLKDLPTNLKYSLEGYLFPATYTFRKNATPEEVIYQMLRKYDEVLSNYSSAIKTSGYSMHEILTVASIIESEAKVSEERPLISGVVYNRLNADMPLQMCSTIQYVLEKRKESLSYSDLEVDSDYNTYQHKGLPPGPICCPGEAAISAAVMPEEHNYYYFVVTGDEIGSHSFAETAADHERNTLKYKQTLDMNFRQ